ncbi:hypothetical protein [Mesomycoplasma hyorhinis]|uniref:Uncharacterized protein n=3 Tax=Mesomycoplasma hyorhinis TaxID=2100 RepID=A0ABD6IE44_MESHY|nr:hypothetical protein [Mesomycoplasma hyorhinis]AEC45904.1 hypothetical protein SRH_01715 [Mesomycoplasma hyorhinis MCLD]AEX13887.1 hypothetical protein MYM_0083 [Mesomycoplasma hyorhinis GDL-1]AFX74020.1 hypothetical protein MOS_088 [Mesomycoplasma hyorhinis SK76]AHA40842.1 hypothetical protein Q453_0088 [Mesomycoplasma hyorhinis DBS 1050]MBY7705513.1 hypothetical protein [Vibrio harveyi]TRM77635.1 hypothetical protein DJ532_03840 [Sulfolobus sp. A20-N-F8]TRM84200.1 hypothetical protein D
MKSSKKKITIISSALLASSIITISTTLGIIYSKPKIQDQKQNLNIYNDNCLLPQDNKKSKDNKAKDSSDDKKINISDNENDNQNLQNKSLNIIPKIIKIQQPENKISIDDKSLHLTTEKTETKIKTKIIVHSAI